MKKHSAFLAAVLCAVVLLPGCQIVSSPLMGVWYTDVQAPYMATDNDLGSKTGMAKADTILGLVARGDCSIQTAADSESITKISHIDFHAEQIWFIYASFETYVYGDSSGAGESPHLMWGTSRVAKPTCNGFATLVPIPGRGVMPRPAADRPRGP